MVRRLMRLSDLENQMTAVLHRFTWFELANEYRAPSSVQISCASPLVDDRLRHTFIALRTQTAIDGRHSRKRRITPSAFFRNRSGSWASTLELRLSPKSHSRSGSRDSSARS